MYVVPVAPVTGSLFPGKVLSVVNVDESVIIFIFILCFSLFFNLKNTEGRPREAFSPGEDKSFLPLSPSYRRQTGHQFACLFFLIVFFYSFFFSIYWFLYIPSVFSTEIFLSRTRRLGADCGRKKKIKAHDICQMWQRRVQDRLDQRELYGGESGLCTEPLTLKNGQENNGIEIRKEWAGRKSPVR